MAYEYLTFDSVNLPIYNPETDLSTGAVNDSLIETIGGVFDTQGNDVVLPKKSPFTVTGVYIGEDTYLVDELGNHIVDGLGNRILVGTAANILRVQIDTLYSRLGVRSYLFRARLDDQVQQWKRCRMLKVNHQRSVNDRMVIAHVSMQFATEFVGWRSFNNVLQTNTMVAHAGIVDPLFVALNAAGNTPIYDAILTIHAYDTIHSISISTDTGIDFTWTGTLLAGNDLVIDCGGKTVRNNGFGAYTLAFSTSHTADGWFPIKPDATNVTVVSSGGGTINFNYYEQYL